MREEKFIKGSTDTNLSFDFFVNFYKNTSKENKQVLLKNCHSFSGTKIENSYFDLCSSVCKDNEEKIKLIQTIQFTVFKAQNINLNTMHQNLEKLGLSNEHRHDFYVEFLKKRKNQIKVPRIGLAVKTFLKKNYNNDQLEEFFPFFPFLQADYKEVSLNIFEISHELSTTTFINLKKVVQKYAIKNWDSKDYEIHISNLCHGIVDYYKLNSFLTQKDSLIKYLKLDFLHSNHEFNLSNLHPLVGEYLASLKTNPHELKHNKEIARPWILQQHLDKNMLIKNEKTKQLKI